MGDQSEFTFNKFLLQFYNKRSGIQKHMYVFSSFRNKTAYGTEYIHKNKAY